MSWRNFTVLAFSSQANPTVIASQRRSNPSVVLHYLKYGLPRRFAPRNDKSEWSLRAKGEAIHLSSCTTWNMDCHVASLLAMTRVSGHCEPKAKQSILSPAPPEIWIATSRRSSQWQEWVVIASQPLPSLRATPRHCEPKAKQSTLSLAPPET